MPSQASMTKRLFAVIATSATICACTSGWVKVGPIPPTNYEVVGPSEGGACGLLLFDLIPIGVNSRTQRAYDEALNKKGTALIDTEIHHTWWWIPYLGDIHCTHVKGTVIR